MALMLPESEANETDKMQLSAPTTTNGTILKLFQPTVTGARAGATGRFRRTDSSFAG